MYVSVLEHATLFNEYLYLVRQVELLTARFELNLTNLVFKFLLTPISAQNIF